MNATFQNGQKVHYVPQVGEPENGIVKSKHPGSAGIYYVVYKCGGHWGHYYNYTAASTQESDLREGWI